MPSKIKNIRAVLSDTKARTIVIVFLVLAFIAFLIAFFHFRSAGEQGPGAGATLPKAPGIQSVPGVGQPPTTYQRLVEQQNIQQAEQAIKAQTAAIPTPVRLTAQGVGLQGGITQPNCTEEELKAAKAAGVSAISLRCRGCDIIALKKAGYTAKDLMGAGYSAKELRDAGYTLGDLKDAGFTAANLKDAGFTAKELHDAGFNARELKDAGFDPKTLRDAGYTAADLTNAGFTPNELEKIGFTESELAPVAETGAVPAAEKPSWEKQLEDLRKHEAEQLTQQEQQDRLKQIQQNMLAQTNDLIGSWVPIPTQQYNASEKQEGAIAGGTVVQAGGEGGPIAQGPVDIYKAGTVMFAVLDTGINSDEQSPILATIVQGCLKGTKLIGGFQRVEEKVVLQFSLANVPGVPTSVPVNAVAIDQNTAHTALSSKVDHHYLLRYGTLFASSFASGLGQAIQTSGSTTIRSENGDERNFWPKLDTGQKALVALGYVGQQLGNVMAPIFNKPPTVSVASGSGIGILIMSDLQIPKIAPAA